MNGNFTINDLRGEYWLYSEGDLRVNVGRGGISGVCYFNTSDVHVEAGGPLDSRRVAEILSKLMVRFGGKPGGYRTLVLYKDGKYDLSPDDVQLIDQELSTLGFQIVEGDSDGEIKWRR